MDILLHQPVLGGCLRRGKAFQQDVSGALILSDQGEVAVGIASLLAPLCGCRRRRCCCLPC